MRTPREQEQAKRERDEFLKNVPIRHAFQKVFDTDAGRLVVGWLMDQGHYFGTSYTRNADTHFFEGERNLVLKIESLIPGLFGEVKMERGRRNQDALEEEERRLMREIMEDEPETKGI